ncbi:hypothetical protein [Streptomyces sp. NPDC002990]
MDGGLLIGGDDVLVRAQQLALEGTGVQIQDPLTVPGSGSIPAASLNQMAERVLDNCPKVNKARLNLPNEHHFLAT